MVKSKFTRASRNIRSGLVLRSAGTKRRYSDEGETSLYAAKIRDLGGRDAPIIK